MINENDIVLVTGATGFTGIHLVRALSRLGVKIRVIARSSSDRTALKGIEIEWFTGDVFDEQVIEQACRGVNYIFHVAAAYREAKIASQVYYDVHVLSTKLLAKYASKQPDFRRFIHTSTIGVHGHIETPPADEEYRFAPGDEYQVTKVEAENWIKAYSAEYQLPMTVVRPAAIYGPGDRRLLKIFKLAKLPVCPVLGLNSKGLYHLIHVEDLVNFMTHVANMEHTQGQVYICGNPSAISIKEMVKVIAGKLGRPARFVKLPALPFFILGDICEFICKPLNLEPPIYRRRVAFFTKDRSFNTNKMQEHAGFTPKYSNKQGIEQLTDWYQDQNWL